MLSSRNFLSLPAEITISKLRKAESKTVCIANKSKYKMATVVCVARHPFLTCFCGVSVESFEHETHFLLECDASPHI